jgi:hypothetical protein
MEELRGELRGLNPEADCILEGRVAAMLAQTSSESFLH